MNLLTLTLLAAFADAPQMKVMTIEGPAWTGRLSSADGDTWNLESEGGPRTVPAARILEVQVETPDESPETLGPYAVVLNDGSKVNVAALSIKADSLNVTSPLLGGITFPRSAVSQIRLAESPSEVDADWIKLTERERTKDMLVVKKENRLDFVEGVVGDVTDEQISFLLNNQTVPVPRERVFGMLFRQSGEESRPAAGEIRTIHDDRLAFREVTSEDGSQLSVVLTSGTKADIPITATRAVDFSSTKLKWLSLLTPRDVKHEFRFIDPAKPFENDRDVWGKPLRLGDRTFSRGVCIRSRTSMRYRLDGDYTRFQALMGIQSGYSGDVRVEISVDGQKVLDQAVTPGNQDPIPVDLDVKDKFAIDILVDFGKVESDIGDHLVLANARLLR